MWQDKRLTAADAAFWIVALAFLAVGARNFEPGLSGDAPLYAAIARHIARTGEWFSLSGGVPDFKPYVEHTHLGFWAQAAAFKILPFADWAARVVGHLYYVGFLLMYFLYVRRVSDENIAVWSVLLLWSWFRFANFFSNVYLDPGALFFGAAGVTLFEIALRERRTAAAPLAGLALGLCALYKGLTVLGFLPVCALLVVVERPAIERLDRARARDGALFLGAFFATCLAYYVAIRASKVPDFLSLYWKRQMSNRFAQTWSWAGLVSPKFWGALFRDTYFLLPGALGAFLPGRGHRHLWMPAALFVTFVVMYAPAERVGNQYQLMFLPWLAWLIAEGVLRYIPVRPIVLVRGSTAIALMAVCVLQYIPVRTHKIEPPIEAGELRRFRRVIYDNPAKPPEFMAASPYAWYGDVEVEYAEAAVMPPSVRDRAYLLVGNAPARRAAVEKAGWCLQKDFTSSTLWSQCQRR